MSTTIEKTPGIQRTFFDLPEKEEYGVEQLEFLSSFAGDRRLTWPRLLESDRILIVSEAGVGKTHESQSQQRRLWSQGESAFFVELAVLATDPLESQFSAEEKRRFLSWISAQTEQATFFLDSVDELKLTQRSFELTIKRFANAIEGHLGRARIVITTRPVAVDRDLIRRLLPVPESVEEFDPEAYFANAAMRLKPAKNDETTTKAPQWRHVALAPLNQAQMREMAKSQGIPDPDPLLKAIDQQHAHDFARRPLDFIELCGDWKTHGRIRTHREQVSNNIDVKLRARGDRSERVDLTHEKAREGAEQLALAALLTRRFTIWYSQDSDRGSGDSSLDPGKVLPSWTQGEISTLLERPLFGFATYGRVRFHNRSVIEFLAAERLQKFVNKGMSPRALGRLLYATTPAGISIVKPTLQPVAAWLAASNASVRADILAREPSILLRLADPASLDTTMRSEALRKYVETYGTGGWRGLHVPSLQIQRLASKELATTIRELWFKGIENPEVRETLLELIGAGRITSCSDIVYNAAIDDGMSERCRLEALMALAAIGDSRFSVLLDELVKQPTAWSDDLAGAAIIHLFPEYMSVAQLLGTLARLSPFPRQIGGTASHLSLLISRSCLSVDQLEYLRQGLMDLLEPGSNWSEQHYRVETPRQELAAALLAVCCLQLPNRGSTNQALFDSIALGLALSERELRGGEQASSLRTTLSESSSSVREGVFWAIDRLHVRLRSEISAQERLFAFEHIHPFRIDVRDLPWASKAVTDTTLPIVARRVALEVVMQLARYSKDSLSELRSLLALVPNTPELHEPLNQTISNIEHKQPEPRWMQEERERTEQAERKHAKNLASWRMLRRELATHPDAALDPERGYTTIWNLWRAMSNADDSRTLAGWNRGFLERTLNVNMANRIRTAMRDIWRRERPTIRSEREKDKRDTYFVRWRLGLASLYAEAEDPAWASSLDAEEADKAARYALLAYDGLPSWLDDVIRVHPAPVELLIGEELDAELRDENDRNSMLLQNIEHSSPLIIQLFLNRVRAWLKSVRTSSFDASQPAKYERGVRLLLAHGTTEDAASLKQTAVARLQKDATHADIVLWLPILLKLDGAAAVEAMENLAKDISPAQASPVTQWLGDLFAHQSRSGGQDLSPLPPQLLLRLARIAYTHIRFEHDVDINRGSNPRDQAQQARGAIANALLDSRGGDAWAAKIAFSNDPLVAHFRDRARAVAKQKLAEEWDASLFDESDVARLEIQYDFAPLSHQDMAALLEDRLAGLDDLLLQDISPRESWRTITAERVLRREISRELHHMARSAYTVSQESVTGDEKETDIRLRSTASQQEGVIELKVAESSYSVKDYCEALEDQLLQKYLAPEHRRAGYLLISISANRHWRHPTNKHMMSIDELIAFLSAEAKRLTDTMHGEVFLAVKVLDLRPRL